MGVSRVYAHRLGANAVIKVEPHNKNLDATYTGEAVIFDKLPDK